MLVAGFGALAALMTSCNSQHKSVAEGGAADAEPISTGLSALLDPKAKTPRLNKPAEVTKDSDYQKLADQAKIDYQALFDHDPKKDAGTVVSKGGKDRAETDGTGGVAEKPRVVAKAAVREPAKEPVIELVAPEEKSGATGEIRAEESKGEEIKVELPPDKARPRVVKAVPRVEEGGVAAHELTAVNPATLSADAPKVEVSGTSAVVTQAPAEFFKGTHAILASKVTGFGRYQPLPSRPGRGTFVFQSARANRAIVYVELENFGYRGVKEGDPDRMPGDQFAVDLSTEMQLLDAHDGLLQMKEPERGVVETSRTKRRDFYLVQEIELPPTLTIGTYNLKVILRDKSGADAVRAEAVIPIQIVGDLTAIVDE